MKPSDAPSVAREGFIIKTRVGAVFEGVDTGQQDDQFFRQCMLSDK